VPPQLREIPPFRATAGKLADDVGLVAVSGELDYFTVSELEAAIQSASDGQGPKLIVDFSAISFIDSTALAMVLKHVTRLAARGGRLIVVSNDPRTARLLEITGLNGRIAMRLTLQEALDELTSAGIGGGQAA
jgi:anti-sigma B factor antagonist